MKRITYYLASAAVLVWAAFSYAYLGVEDGSSGLTPLGTVSIVYFLPGAGICRSMGFTTNAAIPRMFIVSLLLWLSIGLVGAYAFERLRLTCHRS